MGKILKYLIISLLFLVCSSFVFGFTITKEEFANLSDDTIATYMYNNMVVKNVYVDYPNIYVSFDLVNVKENSVNKSLIDVFTSKHTSVVYNHDFIFCTYYFSLVSCADELIYKNQKITYFNNLFNETRTFESATRQAYNKGVVYYFNTINLRDKVILELEQQNIMNQFINYI